MSNLPQLFNYNENPIRTFIQNGDPWFVNVDVCKILEIKNPSSAISKLKENQRGVVLNEGSNNNHELAIISETGLYKLVLRSRKKEAEQFQDWICEQVIPQIRKTGSYNSVQQLPQTLPEALRLYANEVEAKEQAEKRLLLATQETKTALNLLDTAKVKEEMFNALTDTEGMTPITKVGKKLHKFSDEFSNNQIQGWLVKMGVFSVKGIKHPQYSVLAKYSQYFKEVDVEVNPGYGKSWTVNKIFMYNSGYDLLYDLALKDNKINLNQYKQLKLEI